MVVEEECVVFDNLPEGCIANILSFTTPRDVCTLSLVSSTFRSAAESDAVWDRFLPSDCHTIVSQSSVANSSALLSKKHLFLNLCQKPLLIDDGKMSFQLDKVSGKKCYMLSTRILFIVWGDTPRYWRWISLPEARFSEVGELVSVCWLEIRGWINTGMLSLETLYGAYLVFKPSNAGAYGFEYQSVEVSIGISGGDTQKRTVFLDPERGRRLRYQIVPRRAGAGIFGRTRFVVPETAAPPPENDDLQYPKQRADGWLEMELGPKPISKSILQQTVLEIEATTLEKKEFGGPSKNGGKGVVETKTEEVGICLTWKDVWVNASNGKNGSRSILQGLTGYAKPGQLLAIMGPSGCGKSTLLDTLAGRLGSNTRQTGEILINGHKQELAYGTSAYVTQDDTLLTTLTVREAVHYSAQLQLPNTMSKEEKKERADFTIREMGLQDTINTRIGGWGCKGISGGQKRRVSICIEILTRPRLLFLDEPTSGLDSAASYYVMRRIANLNQKDDIQRTIIASIHQPSTEVFQLFHNLCLLSSGRTIYFGPASAACEFFASSGFPCPALQNPSDHLLKTINKDFDQDIDVGLVGTETIPTEEAIRILVSSYKSSERNQEVQNEVAMLSEKHFGSIEKKRGHATFLNQCLVLIKRSSVNMFRDLGYYWLRLGIYVALAISLGTVFYDLGTSNRSIQDRGSLLSFVVGFLTFMTIGGFPSFVEDMKVFERERQNGHYGVTAYVIGNTISSIPFLFMVTVIPGVIAYYLSGLQKGCEHFLYFICVLFASLTLVESLMMIVASLVPNYLMGIITGAGIQGIMLLLAGFFKLPNDLPKLVWRYPLHYVAFHRYALQGMFKNEYEGLRFPTIDENNGGSHNYISGEDVVRNTWQTDMSYSKWVDLAILLGMIVLYRVLFLVVIKTTEMVKPIIGSLSRISVSHNRTIQVVENPNATPLHEEV